MEKIIFIDDEGCSDELNRFIQTNKDKIHLVVNENEFKGEINQMIHKIKLVRKLNQDIVLAGKEGKQKFKLIDILRFVKTGKGLELVLQNKSKQWLNEDIDEITDRLQDLQFIKVHPDYLINIQYVDHIYFEKKEIIMSDQHKIILSEKRLEELLDSLERWK